MLKRYLTIAAGGMLILGVTLCGAQTNPQSGPWQGGRRGRGHWMNVDQQVQRLTKRLNLTDDQAGKVRSILEKRQKEMQGLRSDQSLSREERMSKMRTIFGSSNKKIRDVLNDNQKKTFDQIQRQRRERMQRHSWGQNQ